MEEQEKPAAPLAMRDERGRLLPGSKLSLNRTNPQTAIRMQLQNAFLKAVGEGKLVEVIQRHLDLIQEAKPKEAAALIELLYQYCLGKPIATVVMDVETTTNASQAIRLDEDDLKALERMRSKIGQDEIEVKP